MRYASAAADASSSGTSARQRIGSEVAPRRCAGIGAHDERLRALLFRGSGGFRIVDRRDDGDSVALGDRMAEAVRHTCGS